MKRFALVSAVLMFAGSVFATWTNHWQWSANDADNKLQGAIDAISSPQGVNVIADDSVVSADILDGAIANADLATAIKVTPQSDTNATTTATQYTPRRIGDILEGNTGATTSNTLWIAYGATTNDWLRLGP